MEGDSKREEMTEIDLKMDRKIDRESKIAAEGLVWNG